MTPADNLAFLASSNAHFFRKLAARAGAEHVEDAVQDAFLRAHQNLGTFRGDSQLRTWIGSIVVNCAKMQRRKSREHLRVDSETETHVFRNTPGRDPDPEQSLLSREEKEQLRAAMERMTPRMRHVLQLRFSDMSIEEIAGEMGVPIGTVKARLSRARRFLEQRMG